MGELGGAQKLMIAVAMVFAIGFFMVGSNKEQSDEQRKTASMIRDMANMQRIAGKKCPELIKKHTGTQIASLVSNTKTNKSTFLTLEWVGEEGYNFKHASCTLSASDMGFSISNLVIDDKVIIDK